MRAISGLNTKLLQQGKCAAVHAIRNISGYKVNVENYEKLRKTRKENVTSEYNKFREDVDISLLKKARPKIGGFEVITHLELRNETAESYNEPFYNKHDAQKYNGWQRYYNTAQRVRKQLAKQDTWWKQYDKIRNETYQDNASYKDIGLQNVKTTESNKLKRKFLEERDEVSLEKLSRDHLLQIDLDEVMNSWELSHTGIDNVKKLAHHYGIYKDLFHYKDFYPVVNLEIGYKDTKETDYVYPVYYGNKISPIKARDQPVVEYPCDPDELWTLLLTNPDGHLEDNEKEYAHWLVGNIKGCDLTSAETLVDYMQPFPPEGTGYHRMVFVLFKQSKKIDFCKLQKENPCVNLRNRDFNTREFYEQYKEFITPVSLRFYQTKWDMSVKELFHKKLDMKEPIYTWEEEYKLPRVEKPYEFPENLPIEYLNNFLPAEKTYLDGSREATEIVRDSVLRAAKVI